jgi:hypothetical protein
VLLRTLLRNKLIGMGVIVLIVLVALSWARWMIGGLFGRL